MRKRAHDYDVARKARPPIRIDRAGPNGSHADITNVNRQHTPPRVLIIYFSLSGQSRGLVNLLATGLRTKAVSVTIEQIRASKKINFPFSGVFHTLKMMALTFVRIRHPIVEPSPICFASYDLTILAGPTWSYNPSGPVLSLLDNHGKKLFAGRRVRPLISCRGFYRLHNFSLRRRLSDCGAILEESIIFTHPVSEPCSTIGVFLKSAGFRPEKMKFLAKRYAYYGHTVEQLTEAEAIGHAIGHALQAQAVVEHEADSC